MRLADFIGVLAGRYADEPDAFIVTIGHQMLPWPNEPISACNLPEIHGDIAITAGDIRRWARDVGGQQ